MQNVTFREWLAHDEFVGVCARAGIVHIYVIDGDSTSIDYASPRIIAKLVPDYLDHVVRRIDFLIQHNRLEDQFNFWVELNIVLEAS